MKYFTPDLRARFGSTDEAVVDAAHDAWEVAHLQYRKHLKRIRPVLPKGVRTLLARAPLHDARVLSAGADQRAFFIFVQLAAPADHGVVINYRLASEPKLTLHPELIEGDEPLEWLYDEIDVLDDPRVTAFTHSILFTRGLELQLTFYDLVWMRYRKVVSQAPRQGDEGAIGALEELVT